MQRQIGSDYLEMLSATDFFDFFFYCHKTSHVAAPPVSGLLLTLVRLDNIYCEYGN